MRGLFACRAISSIMRGLWVANRVPLRLMGRAIRHLRKGASKGANHYCSKCTVTVQGAIIDTLYDNARSGAALER